jgi:hypothetical protein
MLLEDLTVLEAMDLLEDGDVELADQIGDLPDLDLFGG